MALLRVDGSESMTKALCREKEGLLNYSVNCTASTMLKYIHVVVHDFAVTIVHLKTCKNGSRNVQHQPRTVSGDTD